MKRWLIWSAVGLVVFLGGPACTRTEEEPPEALEDIMGDDGMALFQPIQLVVGSRYFRYPGPFKAARPIPPVMLSAHTELQVEFEAGATRVTLGPFRLIRFAGTPDRGTWSKRDDVTIDVNEGEGVTVGRTEEGTTVTIDNQAPAAPKRFRLDPQGVPHDELRRQIREQRHLLLFKVTIEDEDGGLTTFDPPWDPKGPTG